MTISRHRLASSVLVLAGTAGCSVLLPNNRAALQARAAVVAGDANAALAALEGGTDLPARLDRATILADMGRPQESNAEFDRALDLIRRYEERATVSATETARGAGSVLVNDKTLEYQGEGFEKVLLHALKARNYLLLGDEEAARVEIRNANLRQDEERRRHAEEIERARKDAKELELDWSKLEPQIDQRFMAAADALRRLDNVYQNPFASYLSAVVYEANGEPDLAFVDYKLAYGMVPNRLTTTDLVRVAIRENRRDEVTRLGVAVPRKPPAAPGNTLVIVDEGFAPRRDEVKFPLPSPGGLLFVAVPISTTVPSDFGSVEVHDAAGKLLGTSEPMVDIEAMSVRNLRDRYPAILVRQLIRLVAKGVMADEARRQMGNAGVVLATVFNAVTEQADLRAWYALPRAIHVARVQTAADADRVGVRVLDRNGGAVHDAEVPLATTRSGLKLGLLRYLPGRAIGIRLAGSPPAGRAP